MLGVHAQTLRYYERVGLIMPSRSRGRIRLYSRADLERVRQVQRLIDELGVNLAGAEVIIDMSAPPAGAGRRERGPAPRAAALPGPPPAGAAGGRVMVEQLAQLTARIDGLAPRYGRDSDSELCSNIGGLDCWPPRLTAVDCQKEDQQTFCALEATA